MKRMLAILGVICSLVIFFILPVQLHSTVKKESIEENTSNGFITNIFQDTTTFSEADTNFTAGFYSSAVWGDYDNDGDLDIVSTGLTKNNLFYSKIFRNDNGIFTDINANLIGLQSAHSASWADIDNDSDLDLCIQGASGPNNYMPLTKIYRNDQGSFVDINANIIGVVYGSTSWGDYDNDGDVDLLITGSPNGGSSFISRIYRNDNANFIDINAGLPGVWGSSAEWGDYDNDGDLDIALIGYGTIGVTSKIYRNDSGIFTDINAQLAQVNSGQISWGDYDNDGDLDLCLTGSLSGGGGSYSTIYRNNNGVFEDIHPGLTGVLCSSISWGDYDSDGQLDLVVSGATKIVTGFSKNSDVNDEISLITGTNTGLGDPIIKVYHNDGGTFTDINTNLQGTHNGSVAWGDYDNDGDLDILLTGGTSGTFPYNSITKIFRNNIGNNIFQPNTSPFTPQNLHAEILNNSVILSWNKATDDQTPQNGLTYNIRIGQTINGVEKVSPGSDLSTGYRKLVEMGNAMQNNQWRINNLMDGTYYWNVQAVDGGFLGSPFSEHQSFIVGSHADSVMFADINANLLGGFYSSVVWGDYDNDGDLDLLTNGSTDTDSMYAKVYRNDGGSFVDALIPLMGVQSAHAEAWVDYDNDCDLDIIIQGATGPNNYMPVTKIYRNDSGNFTDINAGLIGVVYGSISWGDYDNDGDLDLLLTGSPDGGGTFISKIYRNDSGVFVDIQAGLPGVWGSSSSWVDFDNDGDLDISLTGYGDWSVTNEIFKNDKGIFVRVNTSFARANSGALAWGDYDNDGDLDMLYTGLLVGGGGTFTTIYRNDESTFVDIHPGIINVMGSAVAWGDYDNDGWLDIVITGATKFNMGLAKLSVKDISIALMNNMGPYFSDPVTKVYKNDGGTFIDLNVLLPGTHNGGVAWGDYDSDGDLDIALTGGTSQSSEFRPYLPITRIYKNTQNSNLFSQNHAPSTPMVLNDTINENSVILQWEKSIDDHTSPDGLFYGLRLGITPGGSEIVSPLADVSNGFQRVPKIGSCHKTNQWSMKNLQDGIYYWSVQAIDGAYKGSPFSETKSFTIGNPIDQPTWKMISVPYIHEDMSRQTLFSNAITPAYTYRDHYITNDTLQTGIGYWIKFPNSNLPLPLSGDFIDSFSIPVRKGWNMIGSISSAVNTNSITSTPSGMTTSEFFAYAGKYEKVITITPGAGYWVKVGEDGFLHLSISSQQNSIARIRITPDNETPPPPPDGSTVPHIVPTKFMLSQNYPNPFNPTTNIEYQISNTEFVSLKIFDLLGREVTTLVNEAKQPGAYTVNWEATNFPSGVYYYRLKSGNNTETKKLILMK